MMRYEELLVNKNTILLLPKCEDIAKNIAGLYIFFMLKQVCGKHFALACCKYPNYDDPQTQHPQPCAEIHFA